MSTLTTPKAILTGFTLIALSIASIPYSNLIIPAAQASESDVIYRILFCLDGATVDQDSGRLSTYCNG